MASAAYKVFVPKVDPMGNPLRDVAGAAHHYLHYQRPVPIDHAYIDADKRGRYPHDVLVAHAEDTPEADSHFKQLGSYVGELVNHPSIHVAKQGSNGLSTWEIPNTYHRPGEQAENGVLANEPDIAGMFLQQQPGTELGGHPATGYGNPVSDPQNGLYSAYGL